MPTFWQLPSSQTWPALQPNRQGGASSLHQFPEVQYCPTGQTGLQTPIAWHVPLSQVVPGPQAGEQLRSRSLQTPPLQYCHGWQPAPPLQVASRATHEPAWHTRPAAHGGDG